MIRIGIVGYGNLGKGVNLALKTAKDMKLQAVFTRRKPETVNAGTDAPVISYDEIIKWRDKIDVLIVCAGSAKDLPEMTPELANNFNLVDSFDNHQKIKEHFEKVDVPAKKAGKLCLISAGWDPGLFSTARLYFASILPEGFTYTFWGKGVSQGHSDAVRRILGVLDAKQYTIPVENSIARVRNGENPELSTREKHERECFVVCEENADKKRIESEIKNMPSYFKDYNTTVHFITQEEMNEKHAGLPHGGSVIRNGTTDKNQHTMEFSLNLSSNPEFTSSVLVACARAVHKMSKKGNSGCITIFDIPPIMLSEKTHDELISDLL